MRRALVFLPVIFLLAVGCKAPHVPAAAAVPLTQMRPPYDPTLLPKTLAFHESRLKENPRSALNLNFLAADYNQLCRQTGDIADTLRAEQFARRSLQIRTAHNVSAYHHLALSLFTQHRFQESLNIAQFVAAQTPDDIQAAYLVAENQTELGDYAAAEKTMQGSQAHLDDPFGMALRARLLEVNGQPEGALAQMERARDAAAKNFDIPRDSLAWFVMRVGDLQAAQGQAGKAETSYRTALELFPNDQRTLTGLARLSAGRGDWKATLDWGQKAANVVPTPEVIALLGDAYRALNRPKEAEEQYRLIAAMSRLAKAQGVVYDRQRALFLADHDRDLDEALKLARKELKARHDIYAYDTLAWVCLKKGLLPEAQQAIDTALAHNTQDAKLLYHAGMIAAKRGDKAQAKTYLARALARNPYFLPFAPQQARATLIACGG